MGRAPASASVAPHSVAWVHVACADPDCKRYYQPSYIVRFLKPSASAPTASVPLTANRKSVPAIGRNASGLIIFRKGALPTIALT